MGFRWTQKDVQLLAVIAELRIGSLEQLAVVEGRNARALGRRLRHLQDLGLIQSGVRGFGTRRGRPGKLFSLSAKGVEMLQKEGRLEKTLAPEAVTAEKILCTDHQLLCNTFRVQLIEMKRIVSGLKVRFLAHTSPFLQRTEEGYPWVFERIPEVSPEQDVVQFIPDGVLLLTDSEQGKTLLFYLEVDMGTETLASPTRGPQDVRQKIANYQLLFARQSFRRYEQMSGGRLGGFRLLFLSHSPKRRASLCRLVRDMPPSEFIWITDRASLLDQGVWSVIWTRGGRLDQDLGSILGSRKPDPSPRPQTVV